jgi:hypothetical protein
MYTEDKPQFHNSYMQGYACRICKKGMPMQALKAVAVDSCVLPNVRFSNLTHCLMGSGQEDAGGPALQFRKIFMLIKF